MTSSYLIASAEILFTNKVTFGGSRWTRILGETLVNSVQMTHETLPVVRREILQYLRVKGHDVCNILSSGSAIIVLCIYYGEGDKAMGNYVNN